MQDIKSILTKAEEGEEVLPAISQGCRIVDVEFTSSIAYVSSLSITRILKVSANSRTGLSSISMTFSMGREIFTLSPSLCDLNMTFCSVLTHSFALAELSALKKYMRWCVVTVKLVGCFPFSFGSERAAEIPYRRSILPLGKYKSDGSV